MRRCGGRPLWYFCLILTFGAIAGCGDDHDVAAPPEAAAAIDVSIAPVVAESVAVTINATGSFAAAETSDVAPEASGRVVETPVDVGSFVPRMGVLVRVRSVDASLRLQEAQAAAARAEANVRLAESQNELAQTTARRYSNLVATGDVSRTVADQARTDAETRLQNVATARASFEEARAQLALAQQALEDVVVTAPFSGFVSARRVSLGEYVQPNTPVVTLVQLDPLRLQLTIPGVQVGQIQVGQRVVASVDAYPGRTFAGALSAVSPSVDPTSRSFTAEARVPNPDAALKPGMFAVATIDQGRMERALFVPRAALTEDVNTDSFRVFVVDEQNRARLRVVQPASRDLGDRVRIVDGVSEGDRVVVSGLEELLDGSRVTYAEAR